MSKFVFIIKYPWYKSQRCFDGVQYWDVIHCSIETLYTAVLRRYTLQYWDVIHCSIETLYTTVLRRYTMQYWDVIHCSICTVVCHALGSLHSCTSRTGQFTQLYVTHWAVYTVLHALGSLHSCTSCTGQFTQLYVMHWAVCTVVLRILFLKNCIRWCCKENRFN